MFTRTLSADGPDPADVAVELLLAARHEIPPCEIATEAGSRMPGKRLLLQPDELTVDRSCVKAGSRFLWIDRVEAIPRRVKAGMDILHRVTYTFCPQAPVAVVEGALTTRISYKGNELIRDTVADFLLEPGQWAVDAVVTVPPGAQPGDYMLETDFDGSGAQFTKSAGFSVF